MHGHGRRCGRWSCCCDLAPDCGAHCRCSHDRGRTVVLPTETPEAEKEDVVQMLGTRRPCGFRTTWPKPSMPRMLQDFADAAGTGTSSIRQWTWSEGGLGLARQDERESGGAPHVGRAAVETSIPASNIGRQTGADEPVVACTPVLVRRLGGRAGRPCLRVDMQRACPYRARRLDSGWPAP